MKRLAVLAAAALAAGAAPLAAQYPPPSNPAGVTPIGLGFGRIGNFINGELYGRATDVAWCMVFPTGGPVCRHPSQVYEAGLEGLLLFTILWLIGRRATPPSTIFWSFIAGYGACRLTAEFFREPDTHLGFVLGPFSMGQLLSAPMLMVGIFMLVWDYQKASLNATHPSYPQ